LTRPAPPDSRRSLAALVALLSLGLGACGEDAPTSLDLSLLPPEPITLQIELPWAAFGSNLAVYGGFSGAGFLQDAVLARSYAADALNSRVLMRFSAYPASVSVRDANGTLRQDTDISFYGGYLVAFFDTIASTNTGPVSIQLGATTTPWHPRSATWVAAVDTIGDQQLWGEAGGGPVTPLATRDWDPSQGDSIQFFLDSAQVATWADQADPASGARLELLTDGVRLRVVGGALRLTTRSSINPDTIPIATAPAQNVTFVYDVVAPPPVDGMRVGGAPAWRTVFGVAVPAALNGPPELCAAVGCPFPLAPVHVSYAALGLRSRSPADAFEPTDSIGIEVRPVLSPAALPKSPLGPSLVGGQRGLLVAADVFGAQEGALVEIPITNYVRGYLGGPDPAGRPPPGTLAILASSEPSSFTFGEFFGPGGPNEPVLRLVVTVSPPMEIQ
jgi:hypothetical protein